MSMTRKDYELIIDNLRSLKRFVNVKTGDKRYDAGKYDAWYVIVNRMAADLASQNPKFDIKKFLKDCGMMEDGKM